MDNIQMFKEKQINDYLSSIDLSNIDANQIKIDLKNKLGEEPAIKLNYIREDMITEDGNKNGKKIEHLESMTIIFTVDKEILPGQTAPFPITKTFIVG
jgi:hypothetical protein